MWFVMAFHRNPQVRRRDPSGDSRIFEHSAEIGSVIGEFLKEPYKHHMGVLDILLVKAIQDHLHPSDKVLNIVAF